MATQDEVRAVKQKHSARLLQQPGVCGVGVEKDGRGGYLLAVHLDANAPEAGGQVPAEIDGVPVKCIRSGPFERRSG